MYVCVRWLALQAAVKAAVRSSLRSSVDEKVSEALLALIRRGFRSVVSPRSYKDHFVMDIDVIFRVLITIKVVIKCLGACVGCL
jgi:hypothetical protein